MNVEVYKQQYEPTKIKAVDMTIAAIQHYKLRGRPLYAVVLHPVVFDMMKLWICKNLGEAEAEGENFWFDEVQIKKGSTLMTSKLYCEFDKPRGYEVQHKTEKFDA
jgi:hypothetical protein